MADVGDLLHVYALKQIGRALDCLGWRGARAHSGVHEARKSMRHARACLALAFTGGKPPWRAVDRGIARIGRSLSDLRDAQARVQICSRLLDSDTDTETLATLRHLRNRMVRERAACLRQALRKDPGLAQRQRELRLLVHTLDALPWQRVDESAVMKAISHSVRRTRKAGRRALKDGDAEDWHRWRRRWRRLAQQQSVLTDCDISLPDLPPLRRKRMHLLAESQDLAMFAAYVHKHPELSKAQRQRLFDYVDAARTATLQEFRRRIDKVGDSSAVTADDAEQR
jgi:uncharacterized protein YdiU (UPF0061 family)